MNKVKRLTRVILSLVNIILIMPKMEGVEMNKNTMLKEFVPSEITLLDDYYLSIAQKDVDFLNTFDVDKLLFNFRLTARLPNKAKGPYNGWENTRIGGHTLGHYIAAASQAIARGYGNCKGADGISLNARLIAILDGLEECQDAVGTGFIFGATMANPEKPELQFDKVETEDASDTWVPWYTFHKLMNGLVETYKMTGNTKALQIAEKFGEWAYNRTKKWTPQVQKLVLRIEYGGTNDCMYELYKCAKSVGYKNSDHFLFVAHCFDEEDLFKNVDSITNRHANTTIPKFVGAVNRYVTLLSEGKEEAEYLEYCKKFWDLVINHHTYITGGNSECEHFGQPDVLDSERSNCNCETCNTHNMLKLTRTLFMVTGERKYADYYENTFINSILASVNAETGMTTYFQPMATGCFKTYCNSDVNKNYFWCCTGTGLENFTKLGDSFYFHGDNVLYVNQYVSSKVNWSEKGITLTVKTDLPLSNKVEITVNTAKSCEFELALRLPDWLCGQATVNYIESGVTASGNVVNPAADGYLYLQKNWTDGEVIELTLPMKVVAHSIGDNGDSPRKTYAFKYGPIVLAAELGRDKQMTLRQVGVQCDVSGNKMVRNLIMPLTGNYGGTNNLKPLETEIIQLQDVSSVSEFMDNINSHFERYPDSLNFLLKGTDWPGAFRFSPYYLQNKQRYGIYWIFTATQADNLKEKMKAYLEDENETFIEGIGIGYGAQTEGNKNTYPFMEEKDSVADPNELTRYAKKGGYFSYMFKTHYGKKNYLVCTFLKEDNGKTMMITAGRSVLASKTLDYTGPDEKYTERFEIPMELTRLEDLRITFSGVEGKESARLCSPTKTVYVNK